MSDQETYKIVFDVSSGLAEDINRLNSQLSRIQPLTKQTSSNLKDKANSAAWVGAFASGMQQQQTKNTVTKVENKFLKQVVVKQKQINYSGMESNVSSYKNSQEVRRQVFTGADDLRGALSYRNTSPQEIMKIRRSAIQANQEAMAYKERNRQLLDAITNLTNQNKSLRGFITVEANKNKRASIRIRQLENLLGLSPGTGFNSNKMSKLLGVKMVEDLQSKNYVDDYLPLQTPLDSFISFKQKVGY